MVDDILPRQAWEALLADPNARLVDVRTPAEWQHIGVPDLRDAAKKVVLVSWQFPDGRVNADFLDELRHHGLGSGKTLYFICRSGVRSHAAAEAAQDAGLGNCTNVAHGFEGQPDSRGHRGTVSGWKADGLPWLL